MSKKRLKNKKTGKTITLRKKKRYPKAKTTKMKRSYMA